MENGVNLPEMCDEPNFEIVYNAYSWIINIKGVVAKWLMRLTRNQFPSGA
jgi:hypothetical protein